MTLQKLISMILVLVVIQPAFSADWKNIGKKVGIGVGVGVATGIVLDKVANRQPRGRKEQLAEVYENRAVASPVTAGEPSDRFGYGRAAEAAVNKKKVVIARAGALNQVYQWQQYNYFPQIVRGIYLPIQAEYQTPNDFGDMACMVQYFAAAAMIDNGYGPLAPGTGCGQQDGQILQAEGGISPKEMESAEFVHIPMFGMLRSKESTSVISGQTMGGIIDQATGYSNNRAVRAGRDVIRNSGRISRSKSPSLFLKIYVYERATGRLLGYHVSSAEITEEVYNEWSIGGYGRISTADSSFATMAKTLVNKAYASGFKSGSGQ